MPHGLIVVSGSYLEQCLLYLDPRADLGPGAECDKILPGACKRIGGKGGRGQRGDVMGAG